MADIRAVWNADTQSVDWQIVDGALAFGADLETACIVSLFTWARASADDPLPARGDLKGWWGDLDGEALHGLKRVGSKLWLLGRELQTEATRQRAIAYAREALQWMLDDGVATAIEIDAAWLRDGFLTLGIRVIGDDGEALVDQKYDWAWQQLAA